MNRSVVIADSSCLIALDNIGEIELLRKLFSEISVTSTVSNEFGKTLPAWIAIKTPDHLDKQNELEKSLDPGEASSIALALEHPGSLLIIDEKKGRRVAAGLGIEIIGTVGVVLEAYEAGLIELTAALVDRLENANFRVSSALKSKLLNPKPRIQ